MIRQQKFQHAFTSLSDLRSIGANHHAFGRHQSAGSLHLRHFFHFHQAHAAGGLQRKTGVIAKRGDLGGDLLCRLDHQRSGGNLQFAVVDLKRD